MSYPEKEMSEQKEPLSLDQELTELRKKNQELITRIKNLEQTVSELEPLVTKDALTGLDNYRSFKEEIHKAVTTAIRNGKPMSLIFMDIDNFKKINDTNGHLAGDKVLKELAAAVKDGIRENDTACRYGGEEIAVIFPDTSLHNTIGVSERLRRNIAASDQITVSLGVSSFVQLNPGINRSPEEIKQAIDQLIGDADTAMYAAKKAGKNRTGFTSLDGTIGILEKRPTQTSKMAAVFRKT